MNLPLELAVSAAAGTLVRPDRAPATLRLTTDTRAISPGDTFVALRGERYDGHDFASEAIARGAAMLIVNRTYSNGDAVARLLVDDTLRAYMALAGCARRLFSGHVVAITGSTGKTTTKAFLTQLLQTQYGNRVLSPPANENNEIGVSRLLLQASNEKHDVMVVEMGARHYGDVAVLVDIAQPGVGVLTNIGEAHLEIMGSRERLEETKWALFARGARAVLNAADEVSRRRAATLDTAPHWFSSGRPPDHADLRTLTVVDPDRVVIQRSGAAVEYPIEVRVPGRHNRANLAAAIAAAAEVGVPFERMAPRIPTLELPEGRYERITLAGEIGLIYDAYNANASGTIAALDAFSAEPASRRIAVLASMAELGDESPELHRRVGAHAAESVDVLLVCGDFADDLARGARGAGAGRCRVVNVSGNSEAAAWLRRDARRGDVVLLKGSRKYRLEEIVEELRR